MTPRRTLVPVEDLLYHAAGFQDPSVVLRLERTDCGRWRIRQIDYHWDKLQYLSEIGPAWDDRTGEVIGYMASWTPDPALARKFSFRSLFLGIATGVLTPTVRDQDGRVIGYDYTPD